MEIIGTLKAIGNTRNGFTARGEWKSQDIVVGYNEDTKYPLAVMLECGGKTIDVISQLQIGMKVKCNFDVSAVNYQGRWFNRFKCWKIEKI